MRRCLAIVTALAACKVPAKYGSDASDVDGALVGGDVAQLDGDGDGPAVDATPDAGIDTLAPSLVETSPATGATAWVHAPIRLVFDEPLAPASAMMTTATATLAGQPITTTVGFEPPRTLTITFDPAARGVGALAVHVTPMALDPAGNAFTTPIDLALDVPAYDAHAIDRGTALGVPAYVIDDRGTLTAAWLVSSPLGRRVVVAQLVGSTWHHLGDELGIADSSSVSIALDEAGVPLVAVADLGVGHVARWTGSSWTELASPGNADHIRIATPAGGHPVVELVGATTASVRELVDGAWRPLGGDIALPASLAGEPALATPAPSKAVVGWIDVGAQLRTYRLDADWTALAPIAVSAGARMSLAARGSTIAVAYDTWAGSSGVLAAVASGGATTWTQLGRPLDIDLAGDARAPAIALDAQGRAIVAWTELVETAQRGALARWSGSSWTIVGGTSWLATTTAVPAGSRLVLDANDIPIVATLSSGAVRIARFNGPASPALGLATRASLAGCAFDAAAPPALLSQTGCFDLSTASRPSAHAGLVPYDVVAELWSDGAKKRRWIALPAGQSMTLGGNGAWAAPVSTFLVKEFALETTPGNPATRRPVETRFLIHDATTGWQGFSYRWNAQGTDASLLADQAYNIAWPMDDGTQHTHVYPSRAHCRSCHYSANGPLLGLRPEQLARWYDYDGTIADQLPTLVSLGVGPASSIPAFTAPHDPSASAEQRMRGYMAANCAHCHNPQYISIKDLRYATPLAQTRLCEVIAPGSPTDSVVYQKVTSRPGMPPLGTAAVDPLAQELLGTWIAGMSTCP